MKRRALILISVGTCLMASVWVAVAPGTRNQVKSPASAGRLPADPSPADAIGSEDGIGRVRRMDRAVILRELPLWQGTDRPDRIGGPPRPPVPKRDRATSLTTNLLVSAIWLQSGRHLAVVNGRIVREGLELPPFKIRRIQPGRVTFSGPAGDVSVRLPLERGSPGEPGSLPTVSRSPVAGRMPADRHLP